MYKLNKFLMAAILLVKSTGVFAQEWNEEQLQIIEVNRWVALAPKEAGYDSYAALFHPDFTHWFMAGDRASLRTREEYLSLVKQWLDDGNYATYSKVVPISVDVFGDIAYVRQLKEERFHHPSEEPSQFVGQFASLMKKHEGKWTFYRTSFQTRYRGPLKESKLSLDNH